MNERKEDSTRKMMMEPAAIIGNRPKYESARKAQMIGVKFVAADQKKITLEASADSIP